MNSGDSNPTDGDSNSTNGELEQLIAHHFDGHLDVAGERQLADLLAASVEARQTLARYLRLEGAAIKLAKAGELGAADGVSALPATDLKAGQASAAEVHPAHAVSKRQSGRAYAAWLAVAATVLAAFFAGRWYLTNREEAPEIASVTPASDMDQLAEMWLQVHETSLGDEAVATDAAATPEDNAAEEGVAENGAAEVGVDEIALIEADPPSDAPSPPDWMLVAMTDLVANPTRAGEK